MASAAQLSLFSVCFDGLAHTKAQKEGSVLSFDCIARVEPLTVLRILCVCLLFQLVCMFVYVSGARLYIPLSGRVNAMARQVCACVRLIVVFVLYCVPARTCDCRFKQKFGYSTAELWREGRLELLVYAPRSKFFYSDTLSHFVSAVRAYERN